MILGGSSLTLPIKLYEGNNDLDTKLIINYIKSLDTDGDGYVSGDNEPKILKNIINFNDLYYLYFCCIEDDKIFGVSWCYLNDVSQSYNVLSWTFNLYGTLVISWD